MPALPLLHSAAPFNGFAPRNLLPASTPLSPRYVIASGLAAFKSFHRPIAPATKSLQSRQVNGIIPTYYKIDGPAPGLIVGIVLGSIIGFLFLCWLFFMIRNPNSAGIGDEEIVVRKRDGKSPRSRHSRRSSGVEVRETREVSRSPRRERERIIVEDRRAPPSRRSRSIIVEERHDHRVPGDDIIEVIEGSDITPPPRRQRSRRTSDYRY